MSDKSYQSSSGFVASCVCGKICTSKPGLTLHQRRCKQAQRAEREGEPMVQDSDVVPGNTEYAKPVQEMIDMVTEMAGDADRALRNGNKSAGRRARTILIAMKKKITPLRDQILAEMKKPKEDSKSNE